MALKIGNDYLVWVAAPGGTPTYAVFAGQQDGSIGGTVSMTDASHKTSGGYALKVPGLTDSPIDLSFVAELPDTGGYTVVETAFKNKTQVLVQVRKDGTSGAADDAIFACSMWVGELSVNFATNGVVGGSVKFEPAAAPTIPLTLV